MALFKVILFVLYIFFLKDAFKKNSRILEFFLNIYDNNKIFHIEKKKRLLFFDVCISIFYIIEIVYYLYIIAFVIGLIALTAKYFIFLGVYLCLCIIIQMLTYIPLKKVKDKFKQIMMDAKTAIEIDDNIKDQFIIYNEFLHQKYFLFFNILILLILNILI